MATHYFQCLGCGECCIGLFGQHGKIWLGLFLLPWERKLFPSEYIHPRYGEGRKPSHRKFRILAYQMSANVCPHLADNKCQIYENRPLICRSYPWIPNRTVDTDCSFWKDRVDPYGQWVTIADSYVDELSAREKIRKDMDVRKPNQMWEYDVATKSWGKAEASRFSGL